MDDETRQLARVAATLVHGIFVAVLTLVGGTQLAFSIVGLTDGKLVALSATGLASSVLILGFAFYMVVRREGIVTRAVEEHEQGEDGGS